jgi:hypothetical protein
MVGAFFDLNFSEKLGGFLIWVTDASDFLSLIARSPLAEFEFLDGILGFGCGVTGLKRPELELRARLFGTGSEFDDG